MSNSQQQTAVTPEVPLAKEQAKTQFRINKNTPRQ
jgi:hypothetical protein